MAHPQPVPPPSLRPEFALAASSQQFSFKLPDSASQTKRDTQAPTHTQFSSVPSPSFSHDDRGPQTSSSTQAPTHSQFTASQSSSQGSVPSSHSASFLGGSSERASTVPTSRTPSMCSPDEQCIARLHNFPSQNSLSAVDSTLPGSHSIRSSQTHATDIHEHDTSPARLQ